jgi:hypothetical protein
MNSADYLNRLLLKYSGTFDIYQPYMIMGREYPAYGYFFSHVEKYVLVRKANMWSADSYEHILFADPEELTDGHLEEYRQAIAEYIEPTLILKGESLPEPNHMYSYITIAVVTAKALSPEIKKAVRKFKFEKSYMHGIRGYSQARIAVVSMEDEAVCVNSMGRSLKKMYRGVFEDVKAGKSGYLEALKKQGAESFKQQF